MHDNTLYDDTEGNIMANPQKFREREGRTEGIVIKPEVKLSDIQLRQEALRLAVETAPSVFTVAELLRTAEEYENYIREGKRPPATDKD